MELSLQLDDQLQGIDHIGCGSAHEAPNASFFIL